MGRRREEPSAETVVLTLVSSDPDGDVLAYSLSWGDGASESGTTAPGGGNITVRHAFASLGTYQATVTVDDGRRATANASASLLVAEAAFLRVRTYPPVFGKIFVDRVPRDEWGLAWLKIGPGRRVVSFGPVGRHPSTILQMRLVPQSPEPSLRVVRRCAKSPGFPSSRPVTRS
jgi:hypothetical protein